MKLAVIGKIISVESIANADRIKLATVVCGDAGKWSGVVGLDFNEGDLVTVFLQDAILVPDARWAFMERHKWRVRMARFKGVPSECVIVPLTHAGEIGGDLTQALGVTKYEKPIPPSIQGLARGNFPSFIPKTDEPNFQTVPKYVENMKTQAWYATEKADGTSCTVWVDDEGLHVCSRNLELKDGENVYWRMARKYDLARLPVELALQFEIIGPSIQSNPHGLAEPEIRVFSLYDIVGRQYRSYAHLVSLSKDLDFPLASLLATSEDVMLSTAEDLRKFAEVEYANGRHGEGVVIRASDSSWSFKVINLNYRD